MKQNSDYEKRELLIQAAKKEFLEKGYNKASLRTICANAGVTTGALYFFFENKADLFAAIVDGPLDELKKLVIRHFDEDLELMSSLKTLDGLDLNHDDDTDIFVDCLYDNYDSFLLLLTGTENTVYENVVDELVELLEKKIPPMLSAINGYTYDKFMCHWICHISIDGYIHVIKHERDKEAAKLKLRKVTNFLVQGFVSMGIVKE